MNTSDTTELRHALRSAPLPPGLEPDTTEVLRRGHRAQRRRRVLTGVTASTGALTIAAAGFWIANVVTGPQQLNEDQLVAAGNVTVIPANESVFDIGFGQQMSIKDNDDAEEETLLCLEPPPGADPESGASCIAGPRFSGDSNLGFAGDDPSAPVYVWVIRNTTDTAELESDTGPTLVAPVYEVSALDLRIAVTHDLPMPVSGWDLISRDDQGEMTDSISVDYDISTPESPGEN